MKTIAQTTLTIALLASLGACGQRSAKSEIMREEVAPAAAPAAAPAPMLKDTAERRSADAAGSISSAKAKVGTESLTLQEVEKRGGTPAASTADKQQQISSSAMTVADGERKFIRTAQASFSVKDVYQSAMAIEDAVAAQGGFVIRNDIGAQVQKTQRRPIGDGKILELSEYTVQGNLTVRVPSNKTQEFLRAIVGQIVFLDQRSFAAQDAQFDLLRQQLAYRRNQETQEELGQISHEGGKLYQKMDAINSQSDSKAARDEALITRRMFEDRVAFSEINLQLHQASRIRQTELTDVDAIFEQNSASFGERLADSLGAGWRGLLHAIIKLSRAWPLALLILLSVWGVRRYMKGRKMAGKRDGNEAS